MVITCGVETSFNSGPFITVGAEIKAYLVVVVEYSEVTFLPEIVFSPYFGIFLNEDSEPCSIDSYSDIGCFVVI